MAASLQALSPRGWDWTVWDSSTALVAMAATERAMSLEEARAEVNALLETVA